MRRLPVAFAALWLLIGAACTSSPSDRTIDVYAASSLTDAYTILEERFEAENPGVDVRLNLAGSNALLRQILDGGEAHLYAPASVNLVDELASQVDGDAAGTVYASNRLTLVVPNTDGDGAVKIITDVTTSNVLVARCAAGVPCGDATDRYLDGTGLTLDRATEEANVRAVLLKVVSGEVDAGFVYTTDAMARSDEVVEIPLSDAPSVDLALMVLSEDNDAEAFADFVLSTDAADVFRSLGFAVP